MIPLSRWLSDGPRTPHGPERLATQPVGRDSTEFEIRLANAGKQARQELRRETAAMILAALEEEQERSERREAALVTEWTARCAEVTGSALSGLKQELQRSVGKALDDILQPLLPEALRHLATEKLFELLHREFDTAGDEILEVRAPAGMHEKLRKMLNQVEVQAILTESPKIEVLSRHGSSRFESLAGAWAGFVLPSDA